jgi:hypothetical protein
MRLMGLQVSKVVSKLIGAGIASAAAAFLLSQMVSKSVVAPTAPAPQLAQMKPAVAPVSGIGRSDQAALLNELQKVIGPEAPAASLPGTKAASTQRAKLIKTAQRGSSAM